MKLNNDFTNSLDSELLHSSFRILNSSNPQNNGKNGKVVNITKNMIVIRSTTFDKIIKIPKKEILKYCITTKQKMFVLPGKRLLGRPEEVKGKIR